MNRPRPTRVITLIKPGKTTQDPLGGRVQGPETRFTVFAVRQDRGGREGITADQLIGQWTTRFEIPVSPAIRDLSEAWLVEASGTLFDIERVEEPLDAAAIARRALIYAKRRSGGGIPDLGERITPESEGD